MNDGLSTLGRIVAHEVTGYGWRGLTADGMILEVKAQNGGKAMLPNGEIAVSVNGRMLGRRALRKNSPRVGDYLAHYDRGIELLHAADCVGANRAFEAAIAVVPTVRARFNRSLALLGIGRWREGFVHHEARYELWLPPFCVEAEQRRIPRWRGEDIRGKRLLLVHDAGFGDTIMLLRYVPMLKAMGADVSLLMPPELARLGDQFAPRGRTEDGADFYCGMLSLLHRLNQTIRTIPGDPYLKVDAALARQWRERIRSPRWKVGIAWSVGRIVQGDYPRSIPLPELVAALGPDVELHSLQQQERDEAAKLGVNVHTFGDFTDVAALASVLDRIVVVDTAAVHVAGAIGHHNTTLLLSHFASWRWLENPFYPAIRIVQQKSTGDWASALVQL